MHDGSLPLSFLPVFVPPLRRSSLRYLRYVRAISFARPLKDREQDSIVGQTCRDLRKLSHNIDVIGGLSKDVTYGATAADRGRPWTKRSDARACRIFSDFVLLAIEKVEMHTL